MKRISLPVAGLLTVASCKVAEPHLESGADSTTEVTQPATEGEASSAGGTSAPTATIATMFQSESTTPSDGGGNSSAASDESWTTSESGVGEPCETWKDTCVEGTKCNPYFTGQGDPAIYDAMACFPLRPQQDGLGEECSIIEAENPDVADSCERGLLCYAGICRPFCQGEPGVLSCPAGFACDNPEYSVVVCVDICDPLDSDCESDEVCSYAYNYLYMGGTVQYFACVPILAEKNYFEPCAESAECVGVAGCMIGATSVECDDTQSCCNPYCDVGQMNSCPGVGQECVPLFDPPSPYPEYVSLGYCTVQ